MSTATYILATDQPDLLRAWWVLVPAGRTVLTLTDLSARGYGNVSGMHFVVVLDAKLGSKLALQYYPGPVILVGDEGSPDFVTWSSQLRTRVCMSYEQSRSRLGEFLPLLDEIASHEAMALIQAERVKRDVPASGARIPTTLNSTSTELLDFFGYALENMTTRAQLLAEFRRATRTLLKASGVIFFLREEGGFRPDQGDWACTNDEVWVQYLSHYPAVLDGIEWPSPPEASVELALRQKFALWSGRLLVPLHEQGRLHGFIILGVREDGLPYDETGRERAVSLARLLRQFLTQLSRTGASSPLSPSLPVEMGALGVSILQPGDVPPKGTPTPVRALVADVRKFAAKRRLDPTIEQPWRASCGMIGSGPALWLYWEDVSEELALEVKRQRAERLELLRELALTLNHELGNSLVSLAALRHNPGAETNSPVLLAAIKRDISSLELLNRHLSSIPTFSEVAAEEIDIRAMLHAVGRKTGVTIETGPDEVRLSVAPKLIEFGLESILESLAENRPAWGKSNLTIQLRTNHRLGINSSGAQIVIRGPELVLEGIMPVPEEGSTPMHGRIGVFIAKEVIRLHGGTIEAIMAIGGPEIILTLKRW